MPIKRAAFKALRTDAKKRLKNVAVTSRIKTLTKRVRALITAQDKNKLGTELRTLISALDKAAQKGIIPVSTASRKISRISKQAASVLKKT